MLCAIEFQIRNNILRIYILLRLWKFAIHHKGPQVSYAGKFLFQVIPVIPGGVDSACHPSEVGKMSASMLVSCVGVASPPGMCPIAKETA